MMRTRHITALTSWFPRYLWALTKSNCSPLIVIYNKWYTAQPVLLSYMGSWEDCQALKKLELHSAITSCDSYASFMLSNFLTIIPRAQMGSESIADEAEGQMGYRLRGHKGERNSCFSKIQIKIKTKQL